MQVGDKVRYIHNNSYDDNSYMLLHRNTGVITRVAEKHGQEYVEVCFDNPIYSDDFGSRHYFCFAKHLKLIKECHHQEIENENYFEEMNDYLDENMHS